MTFIRRIIPTVLVVCASLAPDASLSAQAISVEDVVVAWDRMTAMVVESVKRMPADRFGYVPTEPLRSFADQVNHTTMSNFGFAYAVGAGEPTASTTKYLGARRITAE